MNMNKQFDAGPACRVRMGMILLLGMSWGGIGLNSKSNAALALFQDKDQPAAPAAADQDEATETKASVKPARKNIYDESADAAAQIDAALAKAKKENRRVLIQWGGNWCGWCHLLHDCFKTNGEVRRKMLYEYDLVLVDVGQADKNLDLAKKYKADFANQGLPFLTVLDASGDVIANQETEALEEKDTDKQAHNPAAVLEFLTSHQATPQIAADALQAGLEQARQSKRMVFLHFGAPWCGWCHRLEDWMARPEVKSILDTAFVDLKIDTDRMEGGQEMLDKFSGGESGGIPWFVIVDPATEKGVANSTGPDGNCGFPFAEEEVAWFGKMLESTGKLLSPEARKSLTDSLNANRVRTEAEQAKAAEAAQAAKERSDKDD